jgi:hypothetical protein
MEKQMGIEKFKDLYFGLGGRNGDYMSRYNDLRKNGRRLKFRVYNESNNKDLIIDVINELNRMMVWEQSDLSRYNKITMSQRKIIQQFNDDSQMQMMINLLLY